MAEYSIMSVPTKTVKQSSELWKKILFIMYYTNCIQNQTNRNQKRLFVQYLSKK